MHRDMLEISPLHNSEFEAWLPLASAYMAFYKTTRELGAYQTLWQRLHSNTNLHSFGARLDGTLVGFTHYFFHPSCWSADVCYLQDLFVNLEARGQGLGRALISNVTEHAKREGSPRVYWLTQSNNESARKLYDQVASHSGFIRYEVNLA